MKKKELKKLLLSSVKNVNILLKECNNRNISVTFDHQIDGDYNCRDGIYENSELKLEEFKKRK